MKFQPKHPIVKAQTLIKQVDREPVIGDICWNSYNGYFKWSYEHTMKGPVAYDEYRAGRMKVFEIVSIKCKHDEVQVKN